MPFNSREENDVEVDSRIWKDIVKYADKEGALNLTRIEDSKIQFISIKDTYFVNTDTSLEVEDKKEEDRRNSELMVYENRI